MVENVNIERVERTEFTQESIRMACVVIRRELSEHKELYEGFLASIQSAISEAGNYTSPEDLSKMILERIIGEEES